MKTQKQKPVNYKVNDRLTVTKTPVPLPQLFGAKFVVANVVADEFHMQQLNVAGNGLLVLSRNEIQNGVFAFKRTKA